MKTRTKHDMKNQCLVFQAAQALPQSQLAATNQWILIWLGILALLEILISRLIVFSSTAPRNSHCHDEQNSAVVEFPNKSDALMPSWHVFHRHRPIMNGPQLLASCACLCIARCPITTARACVGIWAGPTRSAGRNSTLAVEPISHSTCDREVSDLTVSQVVEINLGYLFRG